MSKIYKNWFVHNVISHPLSEVAYWVCLPIKGKLFAEKISNLIHNLSIPSKENIK